MAAKTPDLKIGASFDESEAAKSLANIMIAAGATAEDLKDTFSDMGWDIEFEEVTLEEARKRNVKGYKEIVDPLSGEKTKVPFEDSDSESGSQTIWVPKGSFHRPPKAPKTPSTKNSGGGGGSGKKKKSYWDNPYDELYNLQQK